ncbi:MAG: cysteine desulfurase family protein [Micrococcales bacterium]
MSVYLDHAATTPITQAAMDAYIEALTMVGNPSSVHAFGQSTRRLLEESREKIADSLGANRAEVVFTSGGTESNNLAIKGLFWQRNKDRHDRPIVVTAATEHHATLEPIEWLVANEGAELSLVPVDKSGLFDLNWLESYLEQEHSRIALVTLMWANNETGVINNLRAVTEMAAKWGIPVHSDAVAALGHTEISFGGSGLAAMTITAHKVGGPVGIGALLVSRSTTLESLLQGGGHERGFRSGTMNAAGAHAFAVATQQAVSKLPVHEESWRAIQKHLKSEISARYPWATIAGSTEARLANNLNVLFHGCSGDSLLFLLDRAGVAVSNGSACAAGVTSASHVLLAMGYSQQEASGALRITFGFDTSKAEVDQLLEALPSAVEAAKKAGFAS